MDHFHRGLMSLRSAQKALKSALSIVLSSLSEVYSRFAANRVAIVIVFILAPLLINSKLILARGNPLVN